MLVSIIAFGFLLGLRHATDPDHVVAVATIVSRNKKLGVSWILGACWGLGHMLTVVMAGTFIILLRISVPAKVAMGLEFIVGLFLIALGVLNMKGYSLGSIGIANHTHEHNHDDHSHIHISDDAGNVIDQHSHAHVHEFSIPFLERIVSEAGMFQLLRSAVVGVVHGLAGSTALAMFILASMHNTRTGVVYLFCLGIGTLSGMLILSTLMELSMLYLARWWQRAEQILVFGTGIISLAFGIYVCYNIMAGG